MLEVLRRAFCVVHHDDHRRFDRRDEDVAERHRVQVGEATAVVVGGDVPSEIVVWTEVGEPDRGQPPVVVGVQLSKADGRLVKVVVWVESDRRLPEDEGRRRLLAEGGRFTEGLDVRPATEVEVTEAGGDFVEGGGREPWKAAVTVVMGIVIVVVTDVVVVADVIFIVVTPLGIVVAAPFRIILKRSFSKMTHHQHASIRIKDAGVLVEWEGKVNCAFLDMKRRLRESRLGRRDEGAAATEARALAGRVFVAEAAGEGGRRVLNHAEKTVGELVEPEVDFASAGRVVVVVSTAVRG